MNKRKINDETNDHFSKIAKRSIIMKHNNSIIIAETDLLQNQRSINACKIANEITQYSICKIKCFEDLEFAKLKCKDDDYRKIISRRSFSDDYTTFYTSNKNKCDCCGLLLESIPKNIFSSYICPECIIDVIAELTKDEINRALSACKHARTLITEKEEDETEIIM